MDTCLFCMCLILMFLKETQSESFCGAGSIPIVYICTSHSVWNSPSVLLDSGSVPHYQQTSCQCVISSSKQQPFALFFIWRSHSHTMNMTFQAGDIFIDTKADLFETNITGDTKFILTTGVNYEREGVCLGIYTENRIKINITCKESTSYSSQGPTSAHIVTTGYISNTPVYSTVHVSSDNKHEGNRYIPTVILLICMCAILLVIIAVLLFYIRRLRRLREIKYNQNDRSGIAQISGMVSHEDQIQPRTNDAPAVEITLNEYERLHMYENAPNTEKTVYQQLVIANA